MTDSPSPEVLIVEDEQSVAEGYELWLRNDFDIAIESDGNRALERLDDDVDVVLLDRMMPEISGKEVLQEIRDRGIDCRVAMVSAVEPDFDIIEMGFDAYITKPPDCDELTETVEQLRDRGNVSDEMQEYYSLTARRSALETRKTDAELAESEEYRDLVERVESKERTVDETLGDMGSEVDFVSAVRELEDDGEDFEVDPDADPFAVDDESEDQS